MCKMHYILKYTEIRLQPFIISLHFIITYLRLVVKCIRICENCIHSIHIYAYISLSCNTVYMCSDNTIASHN